MAHTIGSANAKKRNHEESGLDSEDDSNSDASSHDISSGYEDEYNSEAEEKYDAMVDESEGGEEPPQDEEGEDEIMEGNADEAVDDPMDDSDSLGSGVAAALMRSSENFQRQPGDPLEREKRLPGGFREMVRNALKATGITWLGFLRDPVPALVLEYTRMGWKMAIYI